jgi:flagellar hook-length control protein FliK
MLSIDAAGLPGPTPAEAQAVPAAPNDADSPGLVSLLFSLALETETQKAEEPAVLSAPVSETPTHAPRSKQEDCSRDPDYLCQLPFLPFIFVEPAWQNLPSRENFAEAPTPSPDASPEPISSSSGTPAAVSVSKQNPETDAPSRLLAPGLMDQQGNADDVQPAPAGNSREYAEAEAQPTSIGETRQPQPPVRAAIAKSETTLHESRRTSPTTTESAQVPTGKPLEASGLNLEGMAEGVVVPENLVAADTTNEPRPERNVERQDTTIAESETHTVHRATHVPETVAAVMNSAEDDSSNPNPEQSQHKDLQFEVSVRPASKEGDSQLARRARAVQQENTNHELASDLRPGEILHSAPGRSPGPVATRETPTSHFEHWSQIEKSDVLSQLVEKARSLRWDRNSEIVVSLKPESLGRINMRASLVDRTMVAEISADSESVRRLIQVELPVLQRALQESGIPARVVVSDQSNMSLDYNSPSNGQARTRQSMSDPPMGSGAQLHVHTAATSDVVDSRYGSHSVHLIA